MAAIDRRRLGRAGVSRRPRRRRARLDARAAPPAARRARVDCVVAGAVRGRAPLHVPAGARPHQAGRLPGRARPDGHLRLRSIGPAGWLAGAGPQRRPADRARPPREQRLLRLDQRGRPRRRRHRGASSAGSPTASGWPLNRTAAKCIYTGLVTDTGRFQYANTTPEVFGLAQELASSTYRSPTITRQLFEEHRFAYLQLGGAPCRATLDTERGSWPLDHRRRSGRFGVEIDETEGMIDLVRRAAEAEVSCILKETPEGIRVSLRSVSRDRRRCDRRRFGGGGHRYAAGFTARAASKRCWPRSGGGRNPCRSDRGS